ncbi:MAG: copper resistance protein CopZ, partial [Gammaproteobacteria bacterium]|nr:copper resistance protein CopZ [Gammaproteobacteria bacterium]NIT64905.1 copper resistance protein CopZ [Gammaproteobacteria bacterium]NIV21879.1 copper resistance protein CopZ [Gammaproteobacteria bacterium]NIY33485.1 copper resistance protein CopZ [Gammaproteobacteria bacterium]
GPKGQIHLAGMPHPIFFGQAIEVLTYIHMPEQSHEIAAAYVQDMGGDATWAEPGDWIRAD